MDRDRKCVVCRVSILSNDKDTNVDKNKSVLRTFYKELLPETLLDKSAGSTQPDDDNEEDEICCDVCRMNLTLALNMKQKIEDGRERINDLQKKLLQEFDKLDFYGNLILVHLRIDNCSEPEGKRKNEQDFESLNERNIVIQKGLENALVKIKRERKTWKRTKSVVAELELIASENQKTDPPTTSSEQTSHHHNIHIETEDEISEENSSSSDDDDDDDDEPTETFRKQERRSKRSWSQSPVESESSSIPEKKRSKASKAKELTADGSTASSKPDSPLEPNQLKSQGRNAHGLLSDLEKSLCYAVRKLDMEKLTGLLQQDEAREVLKGCSLIKVVNRKRYQCVATLLHDCIKESWSDDEGKIKVKNDIVRALVDVNASLMEYKDFYDKTPFLQYEVHPKLLSTLLELGANPLALVNEKTILHKLSNSRKPGSAVSRTIEILPPDVISKLLSTKDFSGNTPLMAFVMNMDKHKVPLEALEILLRAGADVNAENKLKETPFLKAITTYKDLEVILKLAEFGGNFGWKGERNKSLLHLVAEKSNVRAIKYLIEEKNFNVNIEDDEGLTPLDYLIFKSSMTYPPEEDLLRTIKVIKELGGRLNTHIKKSKWKTLLHVIASNNKEYKLKDPKRLIWIVKLLLHLGFDVNRKDNGGNTPLHLVCRSIIDAGPSPPSENHEPKAESWHSKEDLVKLLLTKGADPNARNQEGKTPFEMLGEELPEWQRTKVIEAIEESRIVVPDPSVSTPVSKNLIQSHNENVNKVNKEEEYSCSDDDDDKPIQTEWKPQQRRNKRSLSESEEKSKSDPSISETNIKRQKTIFKEEKLGSSLEPEASQLPADDKTGTGSTPLKALEKQLCLAVEHFDMLKLTELLQRDDVREMLKRSTMKEAVKAKPFQCVATLIHDCVHDSWEDVDEKVKVKRSIIKSLLVANISLLEYRTYNDRTPFLQYKAHPKLLSILLEFNANPLAVVKSKSILHELCYSTEDLIMRTLKVLPPEIISSLVCIKDSKGNTPLMAFANTNKFSPEILETFLRAGADVNAENNFKVTPFLKIISLRKGAKKVLRMFVEFGGNLEWKGIGNKTLLHLAAENFNQPALIYLMEKNFDLNAEDDEGLTPLDYLTFKANVNNKKQSQLLKTATIMKMRGGRLNMKVGKESQGQTTLHLVTANIEEWKKPRQPIWIVKLLLHLGFDPKHKDKQGDTPLHLICRSVNDAGPIPPLYLRGMKAQDWGNKIAVVRLLLIYGADANERNQEGRTPLEMIRKGIPDWQRSRIMEIIEKTRSRIVVHDSNNDDYDDISSSDLDD